MGKLTISMAMFNSYVELPEGRLILLLLVDLLYIINVDKYGAGPQTPCLLVGKPHEYHSDFPFINTGSPSYMPT